ncbi:hypothetical protein EPN29_10195 [bacterium]|nr:MAG: hypothetical protein EPN29_10195 [bacterium]
MTVAPARLPWRRIWLWSLAAFTVTRAGFLLLTVVAGAVHGSHVPGSLLELWDQWDTHWYQLISRQAYFSPKATVFFPLYPALLGALAGALGHAGGPVWPAPDPVRLGAAMLVANLGGLAAIAGVVALGAAEEDEALGRRAARLFLAYPFAFYLAAAYTEGPFIAFAVWSLLLARRGRWAPAAGLAFLAALTRVTAVILVLPLIWDLGRQRGWWQRQTALARLGEISRLLAMAAAVPAAIGLYMAYLATRFHDPLLFVREQSIGWHRQAALIFSVPFQAAARIVRLPLASEGRWVQTAELLAVLLVAVLLVSAARRQPLAFTLYTAGLLYLALAAPIVSGSYYLQSAGRFMCAAVPAFLALGRLLQRHRVLETVVLGAGFGLQAVFLAAFLAGQAIE